MKVRRVEGEGLKEKFVLNQERKDKRIGRIMVILKSFLSWFKRNVFPLQGQTIDNTDFYRKKHRPQSTIGLNTKY